MQRKSLRQLIRREPQCANCNANCVNDRRLFSEGLPEFLQPVKIESDYPIGPERSSSEMKDFDKSRSELGRSRRDVFPTCGTVPINGLHVHDSSFVDFEISNKPGKWTTVTVLDALLKIFNFQWNYQKKFLKSTVKDKENLILCNDCVWCLSNLYDWFLRFTKLTLGSKKHSYLHQVIFPTVIPTEASNSASCSRNLEEEATTLTQDTLGTRAPNTDFAPPELKRKRGRPPNFLRRNVGSSPDRFKVPKSTMLKGMPLNQKVRRVRKTCTKIPANLGTIKVSEMVKLQPFLDCAVKLEEMTPEVKKTHLAKIKREVDEKEATFALDTKDIFGDIPDDDDDDDFKPIIVETKTALDFHSRWKTAERHRRLQKNFTKGHRSKIPIKLECYECEKQYGNRMLLEAHLRTHQIHDCSFCGDKYSDRRQLRDHLNDTHQDEKKEECFDCNKRFFTNPDLKKHRLTHVDKKAMLCVICNCTFPSGTTFKAHQLTHANSESKLPLFVCPIANCHKRYTNLQLLHSHVRYIHERRGLFVCPYTGCDKSFGTESYLNAHTVSHEAIGSHLCEQCGKNYKHKKDLRIHEQRVHSAAKQEELKPYACNICSKRYYRADHLRIHRVKTNHYIGGQEPEIPTYFSDVAMAIEEFRCRVCNREFVSSVALKTHELTHEDEMEVAHKFSCSDCSRKYITIKALEYHIKYMHRLKNTYACPTCKKSFGRVSSLKRHLSVHINSQHICGECNKRYKNKVDLVLHCKREHVMGPASYKYECDICEKRFYRKDMLRFHRIKERHNDTLKTLKDPLEDEIKTEIEDSVYVLETTEIPEEAIRIEEIHDDGELVNQTAVTILPQNVEGLTDEGSYESETLVVDEDRAPASIESIPFEMVEITEEDDGETTAHVVIVDEDGVTQDIETEVVSSVDEQEVNLSSDINIFKCSVVME